jgi:hypothetical protein
MDHGFTELELSTLKRMISEKLRHDMKSTCDCPFHLMSADEQAEGVDRAVEEAEDQIRRGEIPGARFREGEK